MEEKADLQGKNKTRLTLETIDEKITVEIQTSAPAITEFMELVELLLVNAKYSKKEVESYVLQWARDIKSTKNN